MVIAWHVLNKVTYGQDTRFAKNVLVIAPGLTVKSRLAVLEPANPENYFEAFRIVPSSLFDKLRQGKVLVRNWHALNWETDKKIAKKRGVEKRGAKSDEAYVRDVLGDMASARNLLVINDEAHHAWRVPAESKVKGVTRTRSRKQPNGSAASTESTKREAYSPATTSPPPPSRLRVRKAPRRRCSPGS